MSDKDFFVAEVPKRYLIVALMSMLSTDKLLRTIQCAYNRYDMLGNIFSN